MHTTPRPARARRRLAIAPIAALAVLALGACTRPPTGGGGTTTTAPATTQPGGGATTTTKPPSGGGGTQNVSATIKVSGTFDGKGTTYRGSGNLGSGGDGEGKEPIFQLAPGSTIKNLTIGVPGSDGIHCLGTCRIENVVWSDVLDDAATLKGTNAGDVMTISGGRASNASDKVFQQNGPGKVVIENFTVQNFGKLYRSCGNCSNNGTVRGQGGRHVEIRNVTAIGPGKELAGINVNYGDTATFAGVKVQNDSSKKLKICGYYTGVTSGEPSSISSPSASQQAQCKNQGSVVWG
jgi:hypothetical protein